MPITCESWQKAWRRISKAEVNIEVETEVKEKKEEEKMAKDKNNFNKI